MSPAETGGDSFPRRYARTQRFTLGAPRSFALSAEGGRVVFIRSRGGEDAVGCLWVSDGDAERCVADPRDLGADDAADLPPEERARRERAREGAGGIVSYAIDRLATQAVFTLGVTAYLTDLDAGGVRELDLGGAVIAPRLNPTGDRVAFVRDGGLWMATVDGSSEPQRLAHDDDPDVFWGLPDFIAGEEMDRLRGFWWSPDGGRLAVARVDERPVGRWHIGDPIEPAAAPVVHRYPAAGTPNADVSLHLIDLDGDATPVEWDREALPYLVDVIWDDHALTVQLQSRDQRRMVVATVDPTGSLGVVSDRVETPWVPIIPGVPRWLPDGRLIDVAPSEDTDRLTIDGTAITPPGLQVRRLVSSNVQRLVFTASGDDPTAISVWRCGADGSELTALTEDVGVADAVARGEGVLTVQRRLDTPGAVATLHGSGAPTVIASHALDPGMALNVQMLTLGQRRLRGALLLPRGYQPASGALPVLLDPYGGPHAQRVVRSHGAHVQSQWFADAGFAVLVVDGRGSPGRGPAWEHSIAGDLATAPLEDQVDALHACAELLPGTLDLGRVAIKGWSFGGFLAALAVLRSPDVFHAAIAGAPVTDWTLYDTQYTERYLGDPTSDPETYRQSSLIDDAPALRRPLLLLHGLADDNVVAAHTLRLSRALLHAGRAHSVLPLAGVTHMTPQEVVAENLLHLQLEFLQSSLGVPPPADPAS